MNFRFKKKYRDLLFFSYSTFCPILLDFIGIQIVLASVLAISVQGQYNSDPRTAAIISEQRYLSGDGKFGAAYVQEDGTDFKEETDADGTRRGFYSYVDPTGQKRSIHYTAGKNG